MNEVPPEVLRRLRALCLALPQAREERAWTGTRWCIRKETFAHVLVIDSGWPPAYARAAGTAGPAVVMTFRSPLPEADVHAFTWAPFFRPVWFRDIVGLRLDTDTDWDELAGLVRTSYRILAPRKLTANLTENEGGLDATRPRAGPPR